LHAKGLFAEAEPLMRRALAIDEQSFGRDHPNVAIDLNNLASLLQDTNRLAEAEPLSRRSLVIALQFKRRTGQEHPSFRSGLATYRSIRKELGHSEADIQVELNTLLSSES